MSPDETCEGEADQPIAGLDRVVHEPARLMILAVLSIVESADFLFVARQTGLTRGNLSAHMSKLEAAGYVEITKEFVEKIPRTLLRLTPKGREAFDDYAGRSRTRSGSRPGEHLFVYGLRGLDHLVPRGSVAHHFRPASANSAAFDGS